MTPLPRGVRETASGGQLGFGRQEDLHRSVAAYDSALEAISARWFLFVTLPD
jgi:hypothetical protein